MAELIALAREYGYLTASLLYCALAGVVLLLDAGRRRVMLLSGALAAMATFCMMPLVSLYEADYWRPRRLWGLKYGIEDALFTISIAALAWWTAAALTRDTHTVYARPRRAITRIALLHAAAVPAFLLLLNLGVSSMYATLLTHVLLAAALLAMSPALWRLALAGALGFGTLYLLLACVGTLIAPDARAVWFVEGFLGLRVLWTPMGEVLWGVSFGLMWPLLFAWGFELRPTPCPAPAD